MSAAVARDVGKVRRPELLNKIDVEVNINDAILLACDDGVLTALDDKYEEFLIFTANYLNPYLSGLYLEPYVFGYLDNQENIGHRLAIH